MAPNFQSSFIPNIPQDSAGRDFLKKESRGLMGAASLLIFVLTLLASVGGFAYKWMLQGQVEDLKNQLAIAEKVIDKETINEMTKFNQKLQLTKGIVEKHQIISNFLEILAQNTVSTVSFSAFSFNSSVPGSLGVNLQGKASGYSILALQENVFLKNPNFQSADFSNLNLSSDGRVSFDLAFSVDPKVFLYQEDLVEAEEEISEETDLNFDEEFGGLEDDLLEIDPTVPEI